ncbi:MAG: acetyl-CoA hydrolase/transferase C-terminal domain-containing protein [Thermomonas sp.]
MQTPPSLDSLDVAVDAMLSRIDGPLKIGAPLGLGKPHRFLNALYARIERDPSRPLQLYTALSLDPPRAGSELEARFLDPFVERIYGDDFPRLAYVAAQKRDALPAHVEVEEFYLQSGALLKSSQAQRRYASLNYTHVAAALADRGMNALVQKVAANADGSRLSLSSNTDLTFDAIDAVVARGLPRPLLVAEIDPQLPWIGGKAAVDAGFFDIVVAPPGPYPALFALPRQPVGDIDYAIGLHASTLVRDGGTLQIGIGALSDALCHALVLRHVDNAAYRRALHALDPGIESHPAVLASGGLGPFEQGLFGCSEMINEGFRLLVEHGVIRRLVVDDEATMRRLAGGSATDEDHARLQRDGQYLHGAFYLGSPAFYDWLRGMPEDGRRVGMRRVSEVNDLYGDEALQRLQRREARFFNTCMMATALGAAISDGLADGHVVSGVGGQYNFVAMAHELRDGRSALLLRAFRGEGGDAVSNIRWNYGSNTIPRHLRDLYITEYGIANVLGKTDEDCIAAMAAIADARHQPGLIERAKRERKLRGDFAIPERWRRNSPERLRAALAPFRKDGTLPDYPLGSDFTEVEQRLVRALQWLKAETATTGGKLRTVAAAIGAGRGNDREALQRMQLDAPRGLRAWLDARLVALALSKTA